MSEDVASVEHVSFGGNTCCGGGSVNGTAEVCGGRRGGWSDRNGTRRGVGG